MNRNSNNDTYSVDANLETDNEHFNRVRKLARMGTWKYDLFTKKFTGFYNAYEIYGLEGQEHDLSKIRDIALPEYREALEREMVNLVNGIAPYDIEFQIRRKTDGKVRYVHSIAEFDKERNIVTGILQDITERKDVEKALADSESRYRSLFDNSVSGLIYVDLNGRVLEINRTMLALLGSPSVEETKKINMLEFPLLVKVGFSGDLRRAIDTGENIGNSTEYQSKWGTTHYLEYYLTPIKDGERLIGVMGKIEDITQRKTDEAKIESLLKEKDIILREVHHRIKNNMSSIEGLLRLQVENSGNEKVCRALKDAIGRISSMRILYEKLYQAEDFKGTSSSAYFNKLVDEIVSVFPDGREVTVEKELEDFLIPPDITFVLGIMVNELITNSMKYAFSDFNGDKLIKIEAVKNNHTVKITVRDNGNGISGEKDYTESGFGFKLIKLLSDQIGGTASLVNDSGAVFSIEFSI